MAEMTTTAKKKIGKKRDKVERAKIFETVRTAGAAADLFTTKEGGFSIIAESNDIKETTKDST